MDHRVCNRCSKEKPLAKFPKRKRSKGGRSLMCDECKAESYLPWNRSFPHIDRRASVYAIRAENGLVKIGIAEDVAKRLTFLQTQSPVGIILLFDRVVSKARATERKLHERFREKYSHGEWFHLNDSEIAEMRDILCRTQ